RTRRSLGPRRYPELLEIQALRLRLRPVVAPGAARWLDRWLRLRAEARGAEGDNLSGPARSSRHGNRNQFPPGPFRLRRPILEQRVAAGIAQAHDEDDLG